jgi:EmrB/QacA subfamily drug resistance transporter
MKNNKWWTLLAVCIATFMLLLDVTIVNVALRSIQKDLHSSFSDLQWVVDAYALTLASFLLVCGSLADMFGRKRVFLAGIVVFTLGSLGCGLANDPLFLNLCRGFQGVGGAAMFATALALLAQEFRGKERGTAFGVWGAVTGAGVAVGPLAGGLLTDHLGWESIFFVNIPVGVVAFVMTLLKVSDTHEPHPESRIDWVGFITFSVALFSLVYALVRGGAQGWTSGTIVGALVLAVVLLITFAIAELKQERPMFDLGLFKKPTFIGASAAAFCLSASIFSLFLYITLYFQNILTYTPTQTGVRFVPTTMISFFIAAFAGKASAHLPVKGLLTTGLGFIAIGLFVMAHFVHPDSSWVVMLIGLCFTGFGVGLTNPPLASTAVSVVPPQRSGMASGISSTFRQVGIATGVAGLGAIFQHVITHSVVNELKNTVGTDAAHGIAAAVTNGRAPTGNNPQIAAVMRSAFVHGLNDISYVAACTALAGAIICAITVKNSDLHHGAPTPAAE